MSKDQLPTGTDEQVFALTVHPSVVFKLGEDLITDDVQALTELMKNAYDADSSTVKVRIDTNVWTELRTGQLIDADTAAQVVRERSELAGRIEYLEATMSNDSPVADPDDLLNEILILREQFEKLPELVQGVIEVADRGTGMTLEDIRRGWLTVSASPKRQMKAEKRQTDKHHRTPLGDKGLGRLGAQRLGRVLDLRTRTKDSESSLVTSLFWDDFLEVDALSDVPINVTRVSTPAPVGTTITIRGLRQPEHWDRSRPLFQRNIADMISPYGDGQGFRISLRLNDVPVNLRELTHQALSVSPVTYNLEFKERTLHVSGKMRLEYLRPDRDPEGAADWAEFVAPDNGAAFLAWFQSNRKPRSERLHLEEGDDRYFCRFETSTKMDTIGEVELDSPEGEPVDPGPFEGRVDMIARRAAQGVFDVTADYQQWVKAVTGVRLYRDGFGIRMRDDWLKLGAQWTTGSSFYTLRPDNAVGYINLTSEHNAALEETSNREEFRDLPAYRNFQRVLAEWRNLTELFQTVIRRGYNDYIKEMKQDRNGITARSSSKEMARDIASQFEKAQNVVARVSSADASMKRARTAVATLQEQKANLEQSYFVTPEIIASNSNAAREVDEALEELQAQLQQVRQASDEIADRREVVDLLLGRLVEAERQVREVWEVVSLGITAEAVSHEVLNVTDRLRERSSQIARYNDAEVGNLRFGEYVEQVKVAVQAMHKQISHLDSSMRYVRDHREPVDVGIVAQQAADYFNSRWQDKDIRLTVGIVEPLTVQMSRGKLAQILDNLVLNSEFWVSEALRRGWVERGEVRMVIDSNGVTVEDNGPGVDTSVEEMLFDPFVTRKPGRRGRGLGLFVVQQLLDSEGFTISLDPTRNERGNRYRFRLNLQN